MLMTFFGIEGPYIKGVPMAIPEDKILLQDLKEPITLDRRFDLAMSVEVAEHIPAEYADTLIRSLTSLSDVIVFSAALTGQGGIYHVNEQMPEYWAELFARYGYSLSIICVPSPGQTNGFNSGIAKIC